jgi:hypothetical protein
MKKVKRLKLKEEVKVLLMAMLLISVIVAGAFLLADRNEKIDNGEIIVIDESYIDR